MIDPMLSLAFSIHSNKGVYALLIGSGISAPSGIPTGWDIVIDLVRRIAAVSGESCEPDPEKWYFEKFGKGPQYSDLVENVAKTQTERSQLLRRYFEPTAAERLEGLKVPTAAHRAIAQLSTAGDIKVIITTNFDRLTEIALEEVHLRPLVIANADQAEGAIPLVHSSGVTVIKLHGDYLDTRIKNTEKELSEYEKGMSELLDRVIAEYGLIVCGWSGEWDIALGSSIAKCKSRRYSTYWAVRSKLGDTAKQLAAQRSAIVVKITDGNQFFSELSQKVKSLSDLASRHPLSAKVGMAAVKRYLVEPKARILLRDLLLDETESLISKLDGVEFSVNGEWKFPDEFLLRIARYESLCETLLSMLAASSYWGQGVNKLIIELIERLATSIQSESGNLALINLRRYPLLLLIYGMGVAAVRADNYASLSVILQGPRDRRLPTNKSDVSSMVQPYALMEPEHAEWLGKSKNELTPVSNHLFRVLRHSLREFAISDLDYNAAFDRFEYLYALVNAHRNKYVVRGGWRGPLGRFAWNRSSTTDIVQLVGKEIEDEGPEWPLLGLFNGSYVEALEAKNRFEMYLISRQRTYSQ